MPTVEIDEVELANMNRLRKQVDTILRHPKAKLLVEQAHKMVNPDAPTPGTDALAAQLEPIEALRKEFSDFAAETKKEREERENRERLSTLNATVNNGKAKLRRDGWTDEGIAAVEKVMQEKGILDPLDAAAIYERDHPPQTPAVPSGSGNWNFMDSVQDGEADLKKLIETRGESSTLIDKMARDALNEVRGTARR